MHVHPERGSGRSQNSSTIPFLKNNCMQFENQKKLLTSLSSLIDHIASPKSRPEFQSSLPPYKFLGVLIIYLKKCYISSLNLMRRMEVPRGKS